MIEPASPASEFDIRRVYIHTYILRTYIIGKERGQRDLPFFYFFIFFSVAKKKRKIKGPLNLKFFCCFAFFVHINKKF